MIPLTDDSPLVIFEECGVDYDGPNPDVMSNNNVVVPNSSAKITDEQFAYLCNHVQPLRDDGNYGVNHYSQALDIVNHFNIQESTIQLENVQIVCVKNTSTKL